MVTGLYSSRSRLNVHIGAGVAIGGLIAFRMLWGFMGSTYARFSGFPVAPPAIGADWPALRLVGGPDTSDTTRSAA